MKIKILLLFILICLCTGLGAVNFTKRQNSSIVATWINESDPKWKLVFTSAKCYQYYDGTLQETQNYAISNTTPQCGHKVPVDANTSYLKLTNTKDSTEVVCYEINGITPTGLSLMHVSLGRIFLFNKQK